MNYINNLPHEPGCHGAQGSHSPGLGISYKLACTCPRAEVLARVEAMEGFVEAFARWKCVRRQSLQEYVKDEGACYGRMMDAFAKLEGE